LRIVFETALVTENSPFSEQKAKVYAINYILVYM
jgi:hypothetical protein